MSNIDYYDVIYKYLTAKFPKIPSPQILEATSYIAHQMTIVIADVVSKRDEMWRDVISVKEKIKV